MKNFFKGLLKVFLGIITFISMIVLIIDLTIYSVRNISKQFLNEKEIRKMVENINVLDLLKDEDGNEIKEITEIKEQLINAGIPTETVEEFINSEPVKNLTTNVLTTTIDYVVYDKKPETKEINEEEIYNFIEQNIYEVVRVLKEKNVPKSEELTDERINEVLVEVKKEVPTIKEQVQELTNQIEEKIKETEQYKTLEDYKNNLDNTLTLVRFIYSDYITNIIITVGIVSILLISFPSKRRLNSSPICSKSLISIWWLRKLSTFKTFPSLTIPSLVILSSKKFIFYVPPFFIYAHLLN